jgi:hypothetical protein
VALRSNAGHGLFILEVSRSHTTTHQSVGLLWTSDQLVAESIYVTTHNTHNRQTFMPPVQFEPTILAGERPQTYALDRAATGTGHKVTLTLFDPTSNLVRQYDFRVLLRCRKTSDTVFVAFVRPLSESVRRFSSCSTDFSQQITQVVPFLFLYVFLF